MILTIFFFFNDTATTEIYTLSLHDALPICHHHVIVSGLGQPRGEPRVATAARIVVLGSLALEARAEQEDVGVERSEEHTSELQSPCNLVCRLLLEKKRSIFLSI